ncbi:hypothetical protein [Acuticoccus sp.]|uniref:pyroglutamyl-peptidase I family protein n=1 Tax=Acuticoccus sp. TaxID=1904378 RepID=UPI003B51D43E
MRRRRGAPRTPRLLVTGFGPFPGMPENPTSRLLDALAADPPAGVTARLLPTHWSVVAELAAEARMADAVIMFGVAGNARRIRYERVAVPLAASRPDATGASPCAPPLRSHRTALPVAALAVQARAAGYPVAISHSAGTYVCNAAYAAVLSTNPAALFVHVPPTTRRGPLSAAGLERHARWLIAALTRRRPQRATPARPAPLAGSGGRDARLVGGVLAPAAHHVEEVGR